MHFAYTVLIFQGGLFFCFLRVSPKDQWFLENYFDLYRKRGNFSIDSSYTNIYVDVSKSTASYKVNIMLDVTLLSKFPYTIHSSNAPL